MDTNFLISMKSNLIRFLFVGSVKDGFIECLSFLTLFLELKPLDLKGLKQAKAIMIQLPYLNNHRRSGKNSPDFFLLKYECSISKLSQEKKILRKCFQFLKTIL